MGRIINEKCSDVGPTVSKGARVAAHVALRNPYLCIGGAEAEARAKVVVGGWLPV